MLCLSVVVTECYKVLAYINLLYFKVYCLFCILLLDICISVPTFHILQTLTMNDLHIERVDQILVVFKINSSCLTDSFILS